MFTNMDTDKSGTITYEELKTGLARIGSRLTETEVKQLMEAVIYLDIQSFGLSKFTWSFFSIISLFFSFSFFRLMWMGTGQSTTLNL